MKKAIILFLILSSGPGSFGQQAVPDAEGSLVHWIKLERAMERMESEPRPVLLDFYTDWCGWCKHMMKTTYANPGLANYINTYFYPVKFDAEGKDTVSYLGKTYYPGPGEKRSAHELAIHLLQGKLSYPSTLFLNGFDKEKKEFRLSMLASGYLEDKKIEPILIFTVENVSRNSSLDEFRERFQEAFYDSTIESRFGRVPWIPAETAFAVNLPKRKKSLVFLYTDWCNACKVMQRTSFLNDSIYSNFDLIDFNLESKADLRFQNIIYTAQNNSLHPLGNILTHGQYVLPTLVVLDEHFQILDKIPSYMTPAFVNDVVEFYGKNLYLQTNWQHFQKEKREAAAKSGK